jgi:hypothetical protein
MGVRDTKAYKDRPAQGGSVFKEGFTQTGWSELKD